MESYMSICVYVSKCLYQNLNLLRSSTFVVKITYNANSILRTYIAFPIFIIGPVFVQACGLGLREKLGKPVSSCSDIGPISSYFVERFGFDEACRVIAFTGDNSGSLIGKHAIR